MIIAAIVATGLNNEMGKDNKLIWHLPADLKFFKATTMGAPIIMGRKTYESIGRLLPGRTNIILTKDPNYRVVGAEIFNTLDHAIAYCENLPEPPAKLFIIGGAAVFREAMPRTQEIYRTLIKQKFEADVFLDPINEKEFKLSWQQCNEADENNKYFYCFQKWERPIADAN
jgi:dihydrofolate reductase